MRVVSIQSKMFLGDYVSQRKESVPEWMKFAAGAVTTFILPPLFYYLVSGDLMPFYLTIGNMELGALLGFMLYKNSSTPFISCVPVERLPGTPSGIHDAGLKKAA